MNPDTWPTIPAFENAPELYTIYDRPRDFPNHVVVRRWFVVGDDNVPDVVPRFGSTLEEAREYIPQGLVRMGRRYGQDPYIVEMWMEPRLAATLWTDA